MVTTEERVEKIEEYLKDIGVPPHLAKKYSPTFLRFVGRGIKMEYDAVQQKIKVRKRP